MRNQSPQIPQYPSPTDKSSVSAQFALTNTNTHGHSGAAMDGGQIQYKNLVGEPKAGSISSNGVKVSLPVGWTSVKTGTGAYTVTHGLGTANYAVVVSALGGTTNFISPIVYSNYFTINTFNAAGSATDFSFNFILNLF